MEKKLQEIYIVQFIDSSRFMTSSLSNLVNYLSEGIHKIQCKYRHCDKKCESSETTKNYVIVFLNTQTLKMF